MNYKQKYLKYKLKYLTAKKLYGGTGDFSFDDLFEASEEEEAQQLAKERAEREAKEKAERYAKEKAEREAKEQAEREKAEREAKEQAEREKAEREDKEQAERETREQGEAKEQGENDIGLKGLLESDELGEPLFQQPAEESSKSTNQRTSPELEAMQKIRPSDEQLKKSCSKCNVMGGN